MHMGKQLFFGPVLSMGYEGLLLACVATNRAEFTLCYQWVMGNYVVSRSPFVFNHLALYTKYRDLFNATHYI